MRNSSELLRELVSSHKLNHSERAIALGRLMNELEIEADGIFDHYALKIRIESKIKSLFAREKGIFPGVRVRIEGRKGLYRVSRIDEFGKVRLTHLSFGYSPSSVTVVKE